MKLDVERYLERNRMGFRRSGSKELVGRCWVCGKADHLYVNATTGKWHCFAGKCEASGGTISMIMHLESVSFREARRILASEVMPYIPSLRSELRHRLDVMGETQLDRVATDLPEEFEPCWQDGKWKVPQYVKERGVTKEQLKRFGVGFCRTGRYAGRVVVPVRSPLGYSFTTRTAIDDSLRFLSGKDCGKLLFGWEGSLDTHSPDLPVPVVEGPFDALAVDRCGYPTLGVLGKQLRPAQIAQLRLLHDRTLVLLLDPDATKAILEQMGKLTNVRAGILVGAKDPAVATKDQIDKAVKGAVDRKSLEALALRARLTGCG